MTEHEKMLAGKIYDPFSENMAEERIRAHKLCREYNDTLDTDETARSAILDELLPDRGENVYLQGPVWIDFGTNLHIGADSFANFNFTVMDEGPVTIGRSVFIGPNVSLVTAIHPMCPADRNSFYNPKTGCVTNLERTGAIVIGDDYWLGAGVIVCPGVTIGAGCVIGAGAVVTRDVPPGHFAAGNPCRPIRPITETDRLSAHPEWFEPEDLEDLHGLIR